MAKKKKNAVNVRKLKKQLEELRLLSKDLGNKEDLEAGDDMKEMKNFDEFQQKKHSLNTLLGECRQDVSRLTEIRKNPGAVSARDRIELNQDNDKKLKQAVAGLRGLQKVLENDQRRFDKKKRNALSEKELQNRNAAVLMIAKEIEDLVKKNSRSAGKVPGARTGGGESSVVQSARQKRNAERNARKQNRRKARGRRNKKNDIDDEDFQQMTQQEQVFADEKDQEFAEQDEILTEISKGLTEIFGIATDINKTLKYQGQLLNGIDSKMDDVEVKLDVANDKLKEILEATGGLSTWCPRIICVVFLLALAGYIFTQIVPLN